LKRISEPSDRFISGFNSKEYVTLSLRSGRFRDPIKERGEDKSTIEANNIFDLYFKIPNGYSKTSEQHLLIIINGFDEKPIMQSLYWSKQYSLKTNISTIFDKVASDSNKRCKLASVLLPIPFHHWRRPVKGDYQEWTSSTMILYDSIRLYLGFNQLIYDIDELLNQFENPIHDRYDTYFSKNVKIHLLGYSLGGLAALSYFLRDSYKKDVNKVCSCHLLASGVDLRHINCRSALVPINVIMKMRHYYHVYYDSKDYEPQIINKINKQKIIPGPDFKKQEKGAWKKDLKDYSKREYPDDDLIADLFELIVLGYQNDNAQIKNSWLQRYNNIFYYLPVKDQVNNYDKKNFMIPPNISPNIEPINGCDHFLFDCSPWHSTYHLQFKESLCSKMLSSINNTLS